MNDFKDMMQGAVKRICGKTENLTACAKLSVEIEAQKNRLSKTYEKIGEAVVSGALSSGSGEEIIFKYIDEAKCERERLKALCEKRKKLSEKTACSCGKEARPGSFCRFCGEYVK